MGVAIGPSWIDTLFPSVGGSQGGVGANIEKLPLEELIGLTLHMALRDHGEQGWALGWA